MRVSESHSLLRGGAQLSLHADAQKVPDILRTLAARHLNRRSPPDAIGEQLDPPFLTAFLVGEHLMRSSDPGAALRELAA